MNTKKRKIITNSLITLAAGILLATTIYLGKENAGHIETISKLEATISEQGEQLDVLTVANWDYKESMEKSFAEIDSLKDESEVLNTKIEKLNNDASKYLDGHKYLVTKTLDIVASAYTKRDEEGTEDGITYTETEVKEGRTIAVDPKVIPLGSTVYVKSKNNNLIDGFYIAEDVGGGIKGNRIDVYMDSLSAAFIFGKQDVIVSVLKEVK